MSDLNIVGRARRRVNLLILRTLPPCKEIVQIVSASIDRRLTLREWFVMRLHLVACKPCVRYLEQSEFLSTATHNLDEHLKDVLYAGRLSDAARERIRSSLKASVQ